VNSRSAEISIDRLRFGDEAQWQQLVATSPNATLFHDLEFLRYHPADRFRFQHLMVRRDGKTIAALPGGLVGDPAHPVFTSPVGASVGGPALTQPGVRAAIVGDIVAALQDHARRERWAGIEITLPPAIYHPDVGELVSFALFAAGFRLAHRWLSHILPLIPGDTECFERTFLKREIGPVRAARRRDVQVVECGLDGLDRFLRVFDDTYARHGVTATHSAAEIADLLARLPDRVRIHLALLADIPIGGLLVFRLTRRVATTFYICSSTEHVAEHGAVAAIADLMTRLCADGFSHLDLGPSASDLNFNSGLVFFKEGLGAAGHCRDRWRWDTGA